MFLDFTPTPDTAQPLLGAGGAEARCLGRGTVVLTVYTRLGVRRQVVLRNVVYMLSHNNQRPLISARKLEDDED